MKYINFYEKLCSERPQKLQQGKEIFVDGIWRRNRFLWYKINQ